MKIQSQKLANSDIARANIPTIQFQTTDGIMTLLGKTLKDWIATNPKSGGGLFVALETTDLLTGAKLEGLRSDRGLTLTRNLMTYNIPNQQLANIDKLLQSSDIRDQSMDQLDGGFELN